MLKIIRPLFAGLAAAVAIAIRNGLTAPRHGRMIPIRVAVTAPRKARTRR